MANSPYKKVTHCIFDMDGLLLDTESLYKTIYWNIVSKYGHIYEGELAYAVLGRPERVGAELIINHYKLPLTVSEFQDIYHRMQRELFTDVKLMPGAEKLLYHLKENNVPIALATSSSVDSYELKTVKWKELFDLFHHRVIGGSDPDVQKGKPHPDIFLVAKNRFPDKPDSSMCLVFEDAPNGVQAGIEAGMQVVMVPDPCLPSHLTEKATLVLKSLEDFKPEQFGLPPYKN
ncbi:probable pseudouridine-5'-phosphatase isoform X2 [Cephus cinctus]|uniref:Probable pseudouridine-5'-phosphatase isoform X2 n=1 Tax=Cephus cinctus TaxID=211228 RepID=A0AAJ7FQQ8_CEPCN|nr:probable pseudouridine-5'-phosphatase isoform X2 [Cephus cinctus]